MTHSAISPPTLEQVFINDFSWPELISKKPKQNGFIFGYLFRVVAVFAIVLINVLILMVIGSVIDWQFTPSLLVFQTIFNGVFILFTEHLRSRVYERVFSESKSSTNLYKRVLEEIQDDGETVEAPTKKLKFIRRTLDILFSSTVIITMFPIFVIFAILIKIDSKGPIFVHSQRVGKKGNAINLLRFRTMQHTTRFMNMKKSNDIDRITRSGVFLRKSSLDNMPTFWNVLMGDLSLIGARPLPQFLYNSLPKSYANAYLKNKPGFVSIGGLVGTLNTSEIGYQKLYIIDIRYHSASNLWDDIKILLKVVRIIFTGTTAV